jgi:hypothetical protein|tara:strand:- start:51 stop:245 length:195 start_codon:yes stop_codon:yes gene_type:complete
MNKFFLKSKTVIGAIILLMKVLGYELPFSEEEGVSLLSHTQEVVGLVLIIWGRQTAKQPLGLGR